MFETIESNVAEFIFVLSYYYYKDNHSVSRSHALSVDSYQLNRLHKMGIASRLRRHYYPT